MHYPSLRRLLYSFFLLSLFLHADQITLKNGDRLTGSIVKSDEKELILKTEFAGEVKILWSAITGLTAEQPVTVTLKDGQTIVGAIAQEQEKLRITNQQTGQAEVVQANITAIRNKDEQARYEIEMERLRNPRLLDLWQGYFDTGVALARGNANTSTYNLNANANRISPRDKIGMTFTTIYATNRTSGNSLTTANAVRGGVQYDLNLSKRAYGFGFVNLEFDEFQKLDLRFVTGGGMGYRVIMNERTTLNTMGGGNLNKEFFSTGLRRSSAEVLLGEELTHKFNNTTSLTQKFVVFPNMSESGAYRMNFDIGAVTALRKWLSWQISLSDRFLSNPVPGAKKNDVLATTGIRLTFAR
ncbi:MAG: DUF481 domain-containing protein [Acidobacteria bacterium]|nr:DUF481 domain-containing protein [Acidobacteriota bacterium]